MAGGAKVILYGIDGGTSSVLEPLMRAGRLPTLEMLARRGARATLESTIPWHSAAAWTSMTTGVLPARHGVFNFFEMQPDLRNLPLPSGAARAERLWHILNRRGLRAGVVNVPVTYPAEPVDGFMISGLPRPGEDVHPQARRQALAGIGRRIDPAADLIDGYFIDPRREPDARIAMDADRARAAISLADLQPDFLMYVFSSTDELQHRMWHSWDPAHPAHASCDVAWEPAAIPAAYKAADAHLTFLLRAFGGPDTTVFAVSDHGFGPARWVFFPNRLLADSGRLAAGAPAAGDPLADDPNYSPAKLGFDPRRTRAFMGAALVGPFAEIFISVKGRNPYGIVAPADYDREREEIKRLFLDWADPVSGYRPARAVHSREDVYGGPNDANAPDLLVECAPDCRTMADVAAFPALVAAAPWHIPTKAQTGTHARDGVFFAAGPGIRAAATFDRFSIVDVLPTVLLAMGLPIPEGLDGRPLTELFTHEFLNAHPPRFEPPQPGRIITASDPAALSPEETEAMTHILKGLGYFS